jgi:alcohol dehydrogenase (cytochrome c)
MSPAYNRTGTVLRRGSGCGINTKSFEAFRPGGFQFNATGYVETPDQPRQLYVRALDLVTGKLQWEFKQVGSRAYGAGLLSTAGGLIFAGSDQGIFTALDAKNGKPLWHFNMGQAISADDVQYRASSI